MLHNIQLLLVASNGLCNGIFYRDIECIYSETKGKKRRYLYGKTTQTATTNHIKIDTNNDDSSPAACVCYGHRRSDVRTRLWDTSTELKEEKKSETILFLYVIYACVYFSCPKVHYWCVAKATFMRFNGVHKNLIKLELDERVRIRFTSVCCCCEFVVCALFFYSFVDALNRSLLCAVCIPFSYVHSISHYLPYTNH